MKKAIMAAAVALCLVAAGSAFAAGETKPAQTDAVKIIMPSSRAMVTGLSKSVDPKELASLVKDTSTSSYGFTTGISKEKGSYKLGVLMADLEATIKAGDKEKVSKAVRSLTDGLSALGAPLPLEIAVINMGVAVNAGVDLQAIDKASIPVVKPFIEDFIKQEGEMAYLRLGEWVEATRLATSQGNTEVAIEFLKDVNLADGFLAELQNKGLPHGVISSLNDLSEMGKKKDIGEKDVKAALKAVNNISEIMG